MGINEDSITLAELVSTISLAPTRRQGRCLRGLSGRIYGGQVAAQSLHAAAHGIASHWAPQSIHAHFVAPGDVEQPVVYDITTLKAGRRFTVRRVDASQGTRLIATATVSFHLTELSPSHQQPVPATPAPAASPPLDLDLIGGESPAFAPVDVRLVDLDRGGGSRRTTPRLRLWHHSRTPLDSSPTSHACALAWISDLTLTRTVDLPWVDQPGARTGASLDHTIWFHRPFRADDWLLSDQSSPTYAGARGLTTAYYFSPSGDHVATATQECMIRRA